MQLSKEEDTMSHLQLSKDTSKLLSLETDFRSTSLDTGQEFFDSSESINEFLETIKPAKEFNTAKYVSLMSEYLNTTSGLTDLTEEVVRRHYALQPSSPLDETPKSRRIKSHFIVLNKWSGIVQDINDEDHYFTARLRDLNDLDMPYEEAEFGVEQLSMEDQELLDIGATFYWYVGYENINKTRKNSSILKFNRVKPIDPIEEKRVKELADDFLSLFND